MAAKSSTNAVDRQVGDAQRASRRHRPPEARREQILLAALSCFAEKGYHAATMDDIVRASGLSKGSLYWHFRSKEEVFLAVFDAFADSLFQQWDEAAESGSAVLEVLRRECEAFIDALADNRLLLLSWGEFISHPTGRTRMGEIYQTSREKLGQIVERGRASGAIRPGPASELVAATLIGALDGLALQWLVDPAFPLRDHFDACWHTLMGGLRP